MNRPLTVSAILIAAIAAVPGWMMAQATQPSTQPAGPTTLQVVSDAVELQAFDEARVDQLIAQLSGDDWRDRERASKQLIAIGPAVSSRLEKLIAETTDEEVRSRATSALQKISENRLVGPSIITIKLQGASAKQAFDALSKQAGVRLEPAQPNLFTQQTFPTADIDIEKLTFWAAARVLDEKFGLQVAPWGEELRINNGRLNAQGMFAGPKRISGPFYLACNRITRSQTVELREGAADGDLAASSVGQFNIQMTLMAEPKLKLSSRGVRVKLDEAIDDQGRAIKVSSRIGASVGTGRAYASMMLGLEQPAPDAKKIATLKGSADVDVVFRSETIEIDALDATKNFTKTLGDRTVTFKEMKRQGEQFVIIIGGSQSPNDMNAGLFTGDAVRLVDAQGRAFQRVGSNTRWTNGNGEATYTYAKSSDDGQPIGEPAKLIWQIPVERRTLNVPFEFSNLPIPR